MKKCSAAWISFAEGKGCITALDLKWEGRTMRAPGCLPRPRRCLIQNNERMSTAEKVGEWRGIEKGGTDGYREPKISSLFKDLLRASPWWWQDLVWWSGGALDHQGEDQVRSSIRKRVPLQTSVSSFYSVCPPEFEKIKSENMWNHYKKCSRNEKYYLFWSNQQENEGKRLPVSENKHIIHKETKGLALAI